MRIRCLLVIAAVLAWSITSVRPASAEWFVDLYSGIASTQTNDVFVETTKDQADPTPVILKHSAVDFDSSPSFGLRGGYWDEAWPWLGVAVDFSYFRPDVGRQTVRTTETDPAEAVTGERTFRRFDLSVAALAFDLMLRWPLLTSQEFPKGRLQPYMSGGVALFIAAVDDTANFGPPDKQSDVDAAIGVKASAGLAWQFLKNWALFGEYRFTRFSPEFSFRPRADQGADPFGPTRVETDINTHHFLLGVSFRY